MIDLTNNPLREGLVEERVAEPCVFVIFGATGDLTHRKLIPALFSLFVQGLLPANTAVIGFARRPWSDMQFREEMLKGIKEHAASLAKDKSAWKAFASRLKYIQSSFDDPAGYVKLGDLLNQTDRSRDTRGNRLFYLATPPGSYASVVENLGSAGLNSQERGWSRLVVEKPIGRDLASSRYLNQLISTVFDESQIYRIDHFLGKETVQNILAFRFANSIFEPVWNQKYIDHVQITIAEHLGLEGRGGYFDTAGILRDLVQNHGLQVLTLIAMEPPVSLDAQAIRDEKVKALRAIRTPAPGRVHEMAVRGQYEAGSILGQSVPGYLEEPDVSAGSATETYAALKLHIDNWRWVGVPFYLRAGKRLPKKVTEIALQFKDAPGILFGADSRDRLQPNTLVIHVQPDEGISLRITSKAPGQAMRLQTVRMDFQYGSSFGTASPEAYERLLMDATCGEAALFARDDEVDAAWKILEPVLQEWAAQGRNGLFGYPAGTWGPMEALELFEDGRAWRRL